MADCVPATESVHAAWVIAPAEELCRHLHFGTYIGETLETEWANSVPIRVTITDEGSSAVYVEYPW